MAASTHLLTVEEFFRLPDEAGARRELFHGKVITLTAPKLKHFFIQRNLRCLLERFVEQGGIVDKELAYRPIPEHELWIADVGYLSAERSRMLNPEGNIQGAPDLVIEVLSPSNTASEMYDKEKICLANGAKEFCIVDPDRRCIRVMSASAAPKTYCAGQLVPLSLFGLDATISIDDVFAY